MNKRIVTAIFLINFLCSNVSFVQAMKRARDDSSEQPKKRRRLGALDPFGSIDPIDRSDHLVPSDSYSALVEFLMTDKGVVAATGPLFPTSDSAGYIPSACLVRDEEIEDEDGAAATASSSLISGSSSGKRKKTKKTLKDAFSTLDGDILGDFLTEEIEDEDVAAVAELSRRTVSRHMERFKIQRVFNKPKVVIYAILPVSGTIEGGDIIEIHFTLFSYSPLKPGGRRRATGKRRGKEAKIPFWIPDVVINPQDYVNVFFEDQEAEIIEFKRTMLHESKHLRSVMHSSWDNCSSGEYVLLVKTPQAKECRLVDVSVVFKTLPFVGRVPNGFRYQRPVRSVEETTTFEDLDSDLYADDFLGDFMRACDDGSIDDPRKALLPTSRRDEDLDADLDADDFSEDFMRACDDGSIDDPRKALMPTSRRDEDSDSDSDDFVIVPFDFLDDDAPIGTFNPFDCEEVDFEDSIKAPEDSIADLPPPIKWDADLDDSVEDFMVESHPSELYEKEFVTDGFRSYLKQVAILKSLE